MPNDLPPQGEPSMPEANPPTIPTDGTNPTVPYNTDNRQSGYRKNELDRYDEWIGSYRLLQLLGKGGMGAVWLAEQRKPIFRKVAIKTIKQNYFAEDQTKEILARFDSERQVLALMDHPNIAKIYDAGDSNSHGPYFVMEYCPGKDLIHYCNSEGLGITERLQLVIQLCDAIEHAHQKGIIHRDLKPKNVLVIGPSDTGLVKVIDFGLAKAIQSAFRFSALTVHTQIGEILGTLKYMSPEQAGHDNQDVDTRSDVYSIGVLMYELLTGKTPVDTQNANPKLIHDVAKLVRDTEPPRPSTIVLKTSTQEHSKDSHGNSNPKEIHTKFLKALRDELDWIIMKAIEKDRKRRYQSVAALKKDIENYLSFSPVEARPPSLAYRLRKFTSRNKGVVTTAILILMSLVVSLVAVSFAWIESSKHKAQLYKANKHLTETNAILNDTKRQLEDAVQRIGLANAELEKNENELELQNYKLKEQEKQQGEKLLLASNENLDSAIKSWGSGDLRSAITNTCKALDLNPRNHRALTWLYFLMADRPNFFWDLPDLVIGGSEKINTAVVSRDGTVAAVQAADGIVHLSTLKGILEGGDSLSTNTISLEIPSLKVIYDLFINRIDKRILVLAEIKDNQRSNATIEVWSYDYNTKTISKISHFIPAWEFFVPPFFSPNGRYFVARGGMDLDDPLMLNYALIDTFSGEGFVEFENISGSGGFAVSENGEMVIALSNGQAILHDTSTGTTNRIQTPGNQISAVGFDVLGETVVNGVESVSNCVVISEQQLYTYDVRVDTQGHEGAAWEQREGIKTVARPQKETRQYQASIIDMNVPGLPYVIADNLKYYISADSKVDITAPIPMNPGSIRELSGIDFKSENSFESNPNSISKLRIHGRSFINSRFPKESFLYELPRLDGGYARASYIPRVTSRLPSSLFTEIHWDRRFEQIYDDSNKLFVVPKSLSEIHLFFARACFPLWERASHEVSECSNVHVKCHAAGARMWFAEVLGSDCDALGYNLIQISNTGQQQLKKIPLATGMRIPGDFMVAANSRKLITSTYRPVLEPFACVYCAKDSGDSSSQSSDGTQSVLDVGSTPEDDVQSGSDSDAVSPFINSVQRKEDLYDSEELFVINDLDTGESISDPLKGIVCGIDEYSSRLLVRFKNCVRFFDLLKMDWSSDLLSMDTLITAATISYDGNTILVGTADGSVFVYDTASLRERYVYSFTNKVHSVEISPDGVSAVVTLDMSLPLENAQMQLEKAVKSYILNLVDRRAVLQLPATSKFYGFSIDGSKLLIAEMNSSGYQFVVVEATSGAVIFGPIMPPDTGQGIYGRFVSEDILSLSSGGRTQLFSISDGVPITDAFYHPDLSGRQSAYGSVIKETSSLVGSNEIVLAFGTTPGQRAFVVRLPVIKVGEADVNEVRTLRDWASAYACTQLQNHGIHDKGLYFTERYHHLRQSLNSPQWDECRLKLVSGVGNAETSVKFGHEMLVEPLLSGTQMMTSPRVLSR